MSNEPAPTSALAPESGGYLLPTARRRPGGFVVDGSGALPGGGVAAFAQKTLLHAECLQQLLAEVRDRLRQLDAATTEDSRARLKGAVRELTGVVDWCDAVQAALSTDAAEHGAG